MASTNKTANIDLSQYIGTDKPTYLGDYNSDMLKIDAAVHANTGNITANATSIGTLSNLTTTNKTNLVNAVNEVDGNCDTNTTNMGTLSNLTTTNKTTLVNAINEVVSNIANFNLTSYKQFTNDDFTMENGTLAAHDLFLAKNSDGSLCKLYGALRFTSTVNQSSAGKLTIANTGLTPSEEFTVATLGLIFASESGSIVSPGSVNVTFKTNGTIEIALPTLRASRTYNAYIHPCLLYVTNFGDVSPSE